MIISTNLASISTIKVVFYCTKKISKIYCSYCFFYCSLLFLLIPLIPSCGSINQQLTSILLVVLKSQQVQATFRLVKPNKFRKKFFCATLYIQLQISPNIKYPRSHRSSFTQYGGMKQTRSRGTCAWYLGGYT